jgi:hypothetical protein
MAHQKRLSRKEIAFLKAFVERHNEPRASLRELEALVSKEAPEKETDRGPLPQSIRTALKKRAKKFHRPLSRHYTIGNPDEYEVLYPIGTHPVEPITGGLNILHVDPDEFYLMNKAGVADATRVTSSGTQPAYKTAFASAGDAAVDGPRARMDNSVMLGFRTYFEVGRPGKTYMLRIKSKVTIGFEWIEALSFGRKSWGEIVVDSVMIGWVGLTGQARNDGPTRLLYGVSPRGHHREGDVGVYNPDALTRLTYHEIMLPLVNPPVRRKTVTVTEVLIFQADRHHRVDRCNAVVQGCCSWLPLEVRFSEF